MNFPFLKGGGKKDQIFAVDFGTRTTKAVLMDRKDKDGSLTLSRYAVQDAPIYDKALPEGLLTEHLRNIVGQNPAFNPAGDSGDWRGGFGFAAGGVAFDAIGGNAADAEIQRQELFAAGFTGLCL